jgi:hypothetical protein
VRSDVTFVLRTLVISLKNTLYPVPDHTPVINLSGTSMFRLVLKVIKYTYVF